jgi:AhpD family alkylhydroperoxidase
LRVSATPSLNRERKANVTHSNSRHGRDRSPAARPLLEGVKKQFGVVPNMFRLIANSPAALESYLDLSDALGKGTLPAPTRERIALAVAEINGCTYCLSAHTYLGKNLARLDDAEITANRNGASNDPGRMPRCASLSKSCASAAMSPKTMSTLSRPPATTMRR